MQYQYIIYTIFKIKIKLDRMQRKKKDENLKINIL